MLKLFPWQQSQWQQIVAAAARDMLPHALLLTGPEGVGLGNFASCLAARFLCMQPPDTGISCGHCKTCILFKAGNNPDLLNIQPEEKGKRIRIDSIREMIDFIYLSSHYRRHKIVIIDPADAMNRNAANTLLKTLEEPPPDSLLLRIKFNPGKEQVLHWLQEQSQGNSVDYQGLLALDQSGPLRIQELLDSGRESIPCDLLVDLKEIHSSTVDPVRMAEKWQGLGTTDVLRWLLLCFGRIARLKLAPVRDQPDKSSIFGHLQYLANDLDLQQVVACYDLALKNYHAATGPIALNRQGLLEDMIVFLQNFKMRG